MVADRFCLAALLLATMTVPSAADVTFELVKDVNTTPAIGRADPRYLSQIDGLVYFSATTPEQGAELYATDGTNVQFVREFAAGTASSFPKVAGRAGGRLIVEADDGVQGTALYALDRGSGSVEVLRGYGFPGTADFRFARPLLQLANHLLFVSEQRIYTTDGTAAGTALLTADEHYGRIPGDSVCAVAGGALFVSRNANLQPQIWRTDGNVANSNVVATLTQESTFVAASGAGGQCYFLFRREFGWSLWRSSGGAATPVALQSNATPRNVAVASGGQFAYVIDGSSTMFRLWHTGSSLPVVTYPLEMGSGYARAIGSRLVFDAPYVAEGNRLAGVFVSDGTSAGTVRVPQLNHPLGTDQTDYVVGDALLFERAGSIGRIDVAAASASWVQTTIENAGFSFSSGAAPLGGALIVSNRDQIWRSDGTTAGTAPLHALWRTTEGSMDRYALSQSIGDVLFYSPAGGMDALLMRTDGSAVGTRAVPLDRNELYDVLYLARLGGELLLSGYERGGADQLVYRVTADSSSVRLIVDNARYAAIQSTGETALMGCSTVSGFFQEHHLCALRANEPAAAVVAPRLMQQASYEPVGSAGSINVFFVHASISSLWRSDGTAPGTFPLMTGLRPRDSSGPVALSSGGKLVLDACDGNGSECGLYVTDGSVSGTQFVLATQRVREFHPYGRQVAFSAGSNSTPSALWITDLTAAGTRLVHDQGSGFIWTVATVGDRLHFIGSAGIGDNGHYFVSDGSVAGTREIALPAQMKLGGDFIAAIDASTALFSCHFPATGWESCLIDAHGGNPRLGSDLFPGPGDAWPAPIGRTSTASYFSIDDGYHGRELWRVTGDIIFASGYD